MGVVYFSIIPTFEPSRYYKCWIVCFYDTFEEYLEKTGRIVRYLIQILDMQYPISKDLKRIYEYLIYDISRVKAGRERRAEEIPRISHILSELRDAFNQAGKISGDQHIVRERSVFG